MESNQENINPNNNQEDNRRNENNNPPLGSNARRLIDFDFELAFNINAEEDLFNFNNLSNEAVWSGLQTPQSPTQYHSDGEEVKETEEQRNKRLQSHRESLSIEDIIKMHNVIVQQRQDIKKLRQEVADRVSQKDFNQNMDQYRNFIEKVKGDYMHKARLAELQKRKEEQEIQKIIDELKKNQENQEFKINNLKAQLEKKEQEIIQLKDQALFGEEESSQQSSVGNDSFERVMREGDSYETQNDFTPKEDESDDSDKFYDWASDEETAAGVKKQLKKTIQKFENIIEEEQIEELKKYSDIIKKITEKSGWEQEIQAKVNGLPVSKYFWQDFFAGFSRYIIERIKDQEGFDWDTWLDAWGDENLWDLWGPFQQLMNAVAKERNRQRFSRGELKTQFYYFVLFCIHGAQRLDQSSQSDSEIDKTNQEEVYLFGNSTWRLKTFKAMRDEGIIGLAVDYKRDFAEIMSGANHSKWLNIIKKNSVLANLMLCYIEDTETDFPDEYRFWHHVTDLSIRERDQVWNYRMISEVFGALLYDLGLENSWPFDLTPAFLGLLRALIGANGQIVWTKENKF